MTKMTMQNKNTAKLWITTTTLTFFVILSNAQPQSPQPQQFPWSPQQVLDKQLAPLQNIYFQQKYHKAINVSMGEELTIVLPSFDAQYKEQHFQFRALDDTQYQQELYQINTFNNGAGQGLPKATTGQSTSSSSQESTQTSGTLLKVSELPLKCRYIAPSASVYNTITKVSNEESNGLAGLSQLMQNKLHVHVAQRKLLYVLNARNMVLTAYKYNDIGITMLPPIMLQRQNSGQINGQNQQHKSVSMALNSIESKLVIVCDTVVFTIQTKTQLTKIDVFETFSGFDPTENRGLDLLLHGTHSVMVGMKHMSQVYVFPQAGLRPEKGKSQSKANIDDATKNDVKADPSLYSPHQFIRIREYKGQRIFPQDIAMAGSMLFVLDTYKGVFVFQVGIDLSVTEVMQIGLQSYGGHYRLHVFQLSTLFVSFNDYDGSKVVEVNFDLGAKTAKLVRYYKNDEFLSYMRTFSVLTSSTGFYLSRARTIMKGNFDDRQVTNSFESMLFLVSGFSELLVFPFGLDPRTVTNEFNGVKVSYPGIKQIIHVSSDRFLMITDHSVDYVQLSIFRPEVSCRIGSQYNEAFTKSPENLQIRVVANVSTCEHRNKLLPHKVRYNENCQLTTEYLIHFNDPESSNFRRVLTYIIVLAVVLAFIVGLFCLIQWRNQKLVVLSRLKDEITKFRTRHRRMQPFTAEEQPKNSTEVEMQVPVDVQFVVDQYQNEDGNSNDNGNGNGNKNEDQIK